MSHFVFLINSAGHWNLWLFRLCPKPVQGHPCWTSGKNGSQNQWTGGFYRGVYRLQNCNANYSHSSPLEYALAWWASLGVVFAELKARTFPTTYLGHVPKRNGRPHFGPRHPNAVSTELRPQTLAPPAVAHAGPSAPSAPSKWSDRSAVRAGPLVRVKRCSGNILIDFYYY